MKITLFVSHAFCLGLGALVGAVALRAPVYRREVQDSVQSSAPRKLEDSEPTVPKAALTSKPQSTTTAAADRFTSLRWLRKNGVGVNFQMFSRPSELNPALTSLLDLSDREFKDLQDAFNEGRDVLIQSAVSVARVSMAKDGSRLTIEVPAVAARGSDVFQKLVDSFKRTLGDKYGDFDELCGDELERSLGVFGAKQTTYEVVPKHDPSGFYYEISETYQLPDSQGTAQSSLSPSDVVTFKPILARLIPAGFGAADTK